MGQATAPVASRSYSWILQVGKQGAGEKWLNSTEQWRPLCGAKSAREKDQACFRSQEGAEAQAGCLPWPKGKHPRMADPAAWYHCAGACTGKQQLLCDSEKWSSKLK